MVVQSEDIKKAYAIEGQFEVSYLNKGFEDVIKDTMILAKSFKSSPEKHLKITFRDTSVFICSAEKEYEGLFPVSKSKKMLIIEPIKEITYTDMELGKSTSDITCRRELSRVLNTDQLVITITYLDFIYLLIVLQHHLNHLSIDYFVKASRYYKSKTGELSKPDPEPFTFIHGLEPKMNDLIDELKRIFTYFFEKMDNIEFLRQTFIIQQNDFNLNEGNIKKNVPTKFVEREITDDTTIFVVNVNKSIKLLLINYYRNVFCPLFHINLTRPYFQITQPRGEQQLDQLTGEAEINYYNSQASAWEPLIENFSIEYTRQSMDLAEDIKISLYDHVNINVTQSLITLLKESWNILNSNTEYSEKSTARCVMLKPGGIQKFDQNITYETISEYAIENFSGEIIRVTFKDLSKPQAERILPGEVVAICRDPSDTISMKGIRHSFKINIEFDSTLKIPSIVNVNLTTVSQFIHDISPDKKSKMYFFCSVRVENMRKVFTISTSIQIINELTMPLKMTFATSPITEKVFSLKPNNDKLSIPFSLMNTLCSFSVEDNKQNMITKLSFVNLEGYFKGSNKAVQISVGENKLAVFISTNSLKEGLLEYRLLPPFCISNYLPIELKGRLSNSNTKFSVDPMKSAFIYTHSAVGPCKIELSLQRFQQVVFEFQEKQNVFIKYLT